MKAKITAMLLIAVLFTGLLLFNQNKAAAQEIISDNLFQNPGWEEGYYNQDSISQIAVPKGWKMYWLDNVPFEGTEGRDAYRPETVVWNIADAPENERSKFFRDGIYTLKIFKSWAPMYAGISQDVTGLEVGRKYRIVAPIFVDLVEKYENGQKVPPHRNDSGFVRFGAGKLGAPWLDSSQIHYSPYWTADNVNPFYQAMPIFIWDFVATESDMTLFIEMGSNYPWSNNGFFIDGVGLFALDQKDGSVSSGGSGSGGSSGGGGSAAAPAGTPLPTSTPLPTPTPRADGSIAHIVGAGDTFWSIAIQYAPALGLSAEEALPVIMALNNNPAFISAGQEILIKEPDPNAVAGAAAAESEAASEGETTEGDGEAIVVEGEEAAEAEATATPEASEETAVETTSGGICLQVYEDVNGNELYDNDEALLADAAVTLFRAGNTVTTYITDGVSEPHCIDNLEGGAYEIQVFPPANYHPTTPGTWAVAITDGVMVPVAFGVQEGAAEVAVAESPDAAAEGDTAVTSNEEAAAEEANASSDNGGVMANIGLVVLGIAVVLVLLAGAGVILLRRA